VALVNVITIARYIVEIVLFWIVTVMFFVVEKVGLLQFFALQDSSPALK